MTKNEFDRLVRFFKTHRDYNHGHGYVKIHPPMAEKLGIEIGFGRLVVNTYKDTQFIWGKSSRPKIVPSIERAVPIEQVINGDNIMVSTDHGMNPDPKKLVPVHYKHVRNVDLWLGFGDDEKKAVYF